MRKESIKKLLLMVVALCMSMALFAGCGTDADLNTSGSGSSSTSDSVSSASSATSGPVTIEDIKKSGKLVVATEAAYEPFEYLDGDKIIGYDADLFQKIADDLGVKLEYHDVPFQGILAGLEARKYDVAGACLGITAERASKYAMTYPIQEGTTVLIKRKGDDSVKTTDDVAGKVIGTQTASYNEADLKIFDEQLKKEGKTSFSSVKTYDSFPEAYMELKNSTVDLVAQGQAQSNNLVQKHPDDFEIVPGTVGQKTYLGWAVRKDDKELFDFINQEIAKFAADGTLAQLQEKWFGKSVQLPQSDYIPQS